MPEHVVTATLDGDCSPLRVAATDLGIAAAAWESDEAEFASKLRSRLRVPVVALAEARPDDPAAVVLRAAIPTIERMLRGLPTGGDEMAIDLADRPTFDRSVLDAAPGDPAELSRLAERAQR
jgi:hypothetical protein